MSDIPTSSGIYKITCTANKKIYIGSAVNLHRRQIEHFSDLRQKKHGNPHMQNAWNKYGEQCFVFEVLEQVLSISLTAREQYWLNKLKPFGKKGFNIAFDATSPTLGTKRSPETIEKMRQANLGNKHCLGRIHTPEAIENMRLAQGSPEAQKRKRLAGLERKFSPETREKIRQAKFGKTHTPEAREKMRQAKLGKKLSLEHIEKQNQGKLGRIVSPETREKIRQSMIARKMGAAN